MKSGTFFPYRVGSIIDLQLSVLNKDVHRAGERSIDAYSDSPHSVGFSCELRVDWDGAADLVDGEPRAQLTAGLRIRSVRSRRRTFQHILGSPDHEVIDLEFVRSDWAGTVNIEAVLIRADEGPSVPGLAIDRGAMVGWSEPIGVHFDEPPTGLPGDHLDVRWVHFRAEPELAQWGGHLFSVTSDTPPMILLNLDVAEAYAVLDSKGTSGRRARIRDVIFQQIAHQVWTSLIANAVDNLGELADSYSGIDDQLALLEVHEEQIIRDWAPDLYPERKAEEALEAILEIARSRRVDDLLLRRVPHAIQHRLRTFTGFEGLVREAGLFGEHP